MYSVKNIKDVEIKVEYEDTPIRHIAVRCPTCGNWFYGRDIMSESVSYSYEIHMTECGCPMCGTFFVIGDDSEIDESIDWSEFSKNIKQRKISWE